MAEKWKDGVLNGIDFIWEVIYRSLYGLLRVLNDGYVIRRVAFFWMIWLTTKAFMWAMDLSNVSGVTWDHGILIGAVLTPLSLLHAAIFKFYGEGKPTLPSLPAKTEES